MSKPIQAIRGMNDVLPDQTPVWQYVEYILQQVVESYGYREIRFPIVEYTDLFKRVVGEVTDIVQKEMYTFTDRSQDSLTLRPEGTAGCVRAGIEHGLLYNQVQRWWYLGPLFRHERPQKGRFRQFHQLGVETFGIATPEIEAELIFITARMWRLLGLTQNITLQINSLGSVETRKIYREQLIQYFSQHLDRLDEDNKKRLHLNPLRILDCKDLNLQSLIASAPKLLDILDEPAKTHFQNFCHLLNERGIAYEINPCLVRGLDYYTDTVFEWVTNQSVAQNTICAGGRYDGLVEQMGGKPTPAVGFAIGLERLITLVTELNLVPNLKTQADIYLITSDDHRGLTEGLLLADRIRDEIRNLSVIVDCIGGPFKNQFKRADKSNAQLALILGEQELQNNMISVKYLRKEQSQQSVRLTEIISFLKNYLQRE